MNNDNDFIYTGSFLSEKEKKAIAALAEALSDIMNRKENPDEQSFAE